MSHLCTLLISFFGKLVYPNIASPLLLIFRATHLTSPSLYTFSSFILYLFTQTAHFVEGLYYFIPLTSDISLFLTPTRSLPALSLFLWCRIPVALQLTGGHAAGTLGFEICLRGTFLLLWQHFLFITSVSLTFTHTQMACAPGHEMCKHAYILYLAINICPHRNTHINIHCLFTIK